MALAINLRGDLAKLSDAELADRLAAAWARYDSTPKRWFARPLLAFRGPVRHPRAYRLMMGMSAMNISGHWIDWLLPLVWSSKLTDRLMEASAAAEPDLALFEIRDIMDEIQRRVDSREGAT